MKNVDKLKILINN